MKVIATTVTATDTKTVVAIRYLMCFLERGCYVQCADYKVFVFQKNAIDGMCVNEFLDRYSNNSQ